MSDDRKYRPRPAAPFVTVRSLSDDTSGPVRILGIVIESKPGVAIVQDLLDDVDRAQSIRVIVEGELQVEHKYIVMGEVTRKKGEDGGLLISAILAHDVSDLDVREFKRALELEREVHAYLVR